MKRTIREFRELNHMTQQELADKAGVSIRTIQRIENGDSLGSAFVVKSICKALEIEVNNIDFQQNSTENKQNFYKGVSDQASPDKEAKSVSQLKLLNFSPALVLFLPLLNVVVPGVLYRVFYKRDLDISEAKKIVGFQVLWFLGTMFICLFVPALVQSFVGVLEYSGHPLFFWLYLLSAFFNLLVILETAVRLNRAEKILTYIPVIL